MSMAHMRIVFGALAAISLGPLGNQARGDPINPNNIIVSISSNLQTSAIREYTTSGTLVQTFNVPRGPGGDSYLRDIGLTGSGQVACFNGTFTPFLTRLTPGVGAGNATYDHSTLAGWNTVNDAQYGGVAIDVARNYAYVPDMNLGDPNGIIRFDLTTLAATRVRPGEYNNVTFGRNGFLYGLVGGNHLDVIDPVSYAIVNMFDLNISDVRGLAVDPNGNIYVAAGLTDGRILKFNPQGALTASLQTGLTYLHDVNISNDGRLLLLALDGQVILTTTSLSSMTSFGLGSTSFASFAAWGTPLTVIPEPTSLLLAGIVTIPGALHIVRRWRQQNIVPKSS